MKRWRRSGRRHGRAAPLLLAALLAGALLWMIDVKLRPVVEAQVVNEAKKVSVGNINEAVLKELGEKEISYTELIRVERSEDGRILAVTTDMVKMNELKASVLRDVQRELDALGHTDIRIPLGTLLGSELLHGRGPEVPVRLTLSGNVTAEFQSSFEAAGINQTRHQLYLDIHTSVYSFLPGMREAIDINTGIPVAETVIVGEVPSFLADLKP